MLLMWSAATGRRFSLPRQVGKQLTSQRTPDPLAATL
ncbi:MAG: hypothetical protein QOK48_2095 [Blastocatellia bacterium]|nr:hypothetical protein [Blastocatellia bacterium]